MTEKEKLKDIKKLADAMYYAAQYLTTDASRLKKAMDEYHKFIIHEWREEPVSEDLKTELNKYIKDHFTVDKEQLDRFGIEEKDYMYSMDKSDMLALVEHFTNWQKTKEEPVSEELEEAAREFIEPYREVSECGLDYNIHPAKAFKAGAKWQKQKEYTCYEEAFECGAKWKVENLWKTADGDDLPEIDREVVAFQEIFPTDVDVPSLLKIVIAHRPNPEGYDGKSITTGQVEHYTPKTYDKGGWNISDIKWWLDVELPKEIEL